MKEQQLGKGIRLILKKEKKEMKTDFIKGENIMDLLRRIDIHVDGVLVFEDDSPVPLDAFVSSGAVLTVIDVSSGG